MAELCDIMEDMMCEYYIHDDGYDDDDDSYDEDFDDDFDYSRAVTSKELKDIREKVQLPKGMKKKLNNNNFSAPKQEESAKSTDRSNKCDENKHEKKPKEQLMKRLIFIEKSIDEVKLLAREVKKFTKRTILAVQPTLQIAVDESKNGDTIVVFEDCKYFLKGAITRDITIIGYQAFCKLNLCGRSIDPIIYLRPNHAGYDLSIEANVTLAFLRLQGTEMITCKGIIVHKKLVALNVLATSFDIGCKVLPGAVLDANSLCLTEGKIGLIAERGSILKGNNLVLERQETGLVLKDYTGQGLNNAYFVFGDDVSNKTVVVLDQNDGWFNRGMFLRKAKLRGCKSWVKKPCESFSFVMDFNEND